MQEIQAIIDEVYGDRDVLDLSTICEDLVAAAAPEEIIRAASSLPKRKYRRDEAIGALKALRPDSAAFPRRSAQN